MNSLRIIGVVCVLILAVQGNWNEKDMAALTEKGKECQKECNASDEDMKTLMNQKMPENKEGQCVPGCVFEGLGIMKKIGEKFQLDIQAIVKKSEEKNLGADKITAIKTACEKCNAEVDDKTNRTDAALKIAECLSKSMGPH